MIYIRPITEAENINYVLSDSHEGKKFGMKAMGFWKRTKNFETNPPWGLFVGGGLAAVCHITKARSPKRKYCNLYYISTHSKHQRKGYARILYQAIVIEMLKEGMEWIKLSSEMEATPFWIRMGFWFMGWDKTCSLRAACPLLLPEQLKEARTQWIMTPEKFLPPENVKLDSIKPSMIKKLEANIVLANPYFKRFDLIKPTVDAFI